MLVLCVGMYRACSTWQYGVAGSILERHQGVRMLGFVDGGRFELETEPDLGPSNWSILKAHDAHERFAQVLLEGRALAIYAYRDLRDVALSWSHKQGVPLDEILSNGFLDRCLKNDRFWRIQPGTLVQTYENLIADPVQGVLEIAAHLGVELLEGEAQEISDAHSFEANKQRTAELSERIRSEGSELIPTDQDHYDADSLLHWNHLREGRSGGWRDQTSADQRATLARACGAWLVENGYETDESWAGVKAVATPELPRVSYAQNMEDILLDRLFHGRSGSFIDVGANHPTHNNNTYFFYLRGWRGVNIEPVPSARAVFESSRPGDLNLSIAASDVSGVLPFYEVQDCTGLSSLSIEVAEEQKSRGFPAIEHQVPTRTIAELADHYRWEPPEIFSIDVEGNEERVLRGIPLDRWQPQVFVIEATMPMTNTPCHQQWEPILLEHGYLFAAFDGINRYYLRSDRAEWLPRLSYPVNSLDFYERADLVEQRARADEQARIVEENHSRTEEHRAYLEHELTHFRQESAHFRQEALHHESARVRDGSEALARLASERDAWQSERDAWQRERDSIQVERDSIQRERDGHQVERDSIQRERDSVQRERDAFQRERDAVQRERDDRNDDREARHAERATALADRESWLFERVRLQTEIDRSQRLAQNLGDEIDRLRLALARSESESHEARQAHQSTLDEVERDRAEQAAERERQTVALSTIHRPHRLMDRLGVSALHRRVSRSRSDSNP